MTSESAAQQEKHPGPRLREARMHLHNPADPGTGVVVSSELCTKGKSASCVRHIVVDVSQSRLSGAFLSGQSFGVLPPGNDAKGRPHQVRLYSIAAPTTGEDGDGRHVSTTVKRTVDEHWESHKLFLGVASNYLCDLQVGDSVRITGPSGKRFVLPANPQDHDYLFFATGTGIAPFRGMLLDLLRPKAGPPCKGRMALLMGVPYEMDLLYDGLFTDLAREHDNFRYHTAFSRHAQADMNRTLYVQQRLEAQRDELSAMLASPRTLIYICGIVGMEVGIFQSLARILPPEALEQYLSIAPEVRGSIDSWTRVMVNRQIKPTRRVFTEVYS
ncbi:MAG: hypothetical protein IT435_08805 [Phycisphaerales bacterium]|nr:hypothetical protein [Phycisphaerales bacterium]